MGWVAHAHWLATLRDFDRIVLLGGGQVVGQGTPAGLAHRPGPYHDLLDRQTLVPLERAA